jgi:hypothetical protein
MKKLLLAALCFGTVTSTFAQGTVAFNNNTTFRTTNSAGLGFPPAGSTDYKVGLYWGAAGSSEGSLQLLPAASGGVTTTWTQNGVFNGGLATFPSPGGTVIALQVRVWSSAFNDYEAAFTANPTGIGGKGVVQRITLGNAPGIPAPSFPADMTNPTGAGDTPMTRFAVVGVIPEPSSIALGLLGLGAIVLFRRRK